jgi:hypothetical protein
LSSMVRFWRIRSRPFAPPSPLCLTTISIHSHTDRARSLTELRYRGHR